MDTANPKFAVHSNIKVDNQRLEQAQSGRVIQDFGSSYNISENKFFNSKEAIRVKAAATVRNDSFLNDFVSDYEASEAEAIAFSASKTL